MTYFAFVNNVKTTLAAPISSGATTMTLSDVSQLPSSIPAGETIVFVLRDAATGNNYEIVYATAISSSTLTITRAQEGTTALAWGAGDDAYSGITAAQMDNVTSGKLLGVTPISSSTTFNPNPQANTTIISGTGAGGSGGNSSNTGAGQVSLGGGGMCGASGEAIFVGKLSGPITVTIGLGGTPSAALGANGTAGGDSTFGSLITFPGGAAGGGGAAVTAPAAVAVPGSSVLSPTTTGVFLWSKGTSNTNSTSMALSSSVLIAANGTANNYGFGNSGRGAGGGGVATGPSASGSAGGTGRDGLFIITEYS